MTHSGAMGTYLTDGSGKSLYLWDADTKAGKSTCSGPCLKFWPPLTTKGTPTASGDAQSSMLATITRSDGSKQVTYAGHPLYYYSKDTSPGDTNGQGNDDLGPKWWLVSPDGKSITSTSGGSSDKSSGGDAGGGWG